MKKEPIAILGMGCRYPQAAGIEAFWRLLVEGRDAIGPYPGGRFRELDAEYAAAAAGGGKVATNLGGFLPGIDLFDAAFFGISPREAHYVDPQQRLLLEVSWDALEDAGQLREDYEGTRTGVFTGLWTTEYEQLTYRMAPKPEFYMLTGGGRSTACGRVSFTFGFEGPSVSVDTACSSSMVAIHMACQALRNGECEMALAGGVNVIVAADQTKLFTHAGMLAKDGHCKFGDESADGFVRSEGAGMVVLKRLSDAVAAGDPVYAVIHGSSVNNDGRSGGLMVTPSREGQKNMLLEAWSEAGITADEIAYIEAHGTGTHAGDPVEVGAIGDALRQAGARERVPLGSLKTNIGHTESAAGVAGVIKAALVLHEGVIPPSLNCVTPNPEIDWGGRPIEIVRERRPLPVRADGGARYVGASSFGLTGTNSHMLLGEFAAVAGLNCEGDSGSNGLESDGFGLGSLLLPITAYSAESLRGNARRWIAYLDREWTAADLAEICYLAGARRTPLGHRFAAVGRDATELRLQLEAFLAGEASASPEAGVAADAAAKVVFVAPGQGSQWDGMARELYREHAAFREAFDACDGAIAAETGWSLVERLKSAEAAEFLKQIDFVQPALFAMSVALAAVWRVAGVVPGVVVGHSMGEVAAAYLARALTLEDAAAVICRRSRLMRRLSGTGSGSGSMVSVEMPAAELADWLVQFEGRVSIAAENSAGTTVVSGESEAVEQLLEWLELKEVFCRRVKVDVASHSLMVDPILAELEAGLAGLKPRAAAIPFFSTVKGAYVSGTELNAGYWVRNLREPVRLATATRVLLDEGYNKFVELSPHPILAPALETTLRGRPAAQALALPSLVRGGAAWAAMLRSLGRYWVGGGKLDWARLTGRGDGPVSRRFRLPEYAFERERFWMEEPEAATVVAARLSPLLASRTDPANEPGTSLFAVIADLKALPYLADHKVGGAVVFPASAHVETALEAGRVLGSGKTARLVDVEFRQALYLSESETPEVQLVVRRVIGSADRFSFALLGRAGSGEGGWTEHSTGTMVLEDAVFAVTDGGMPVGLDAAARTGSGAEHYRKARRAGLDYGPAFQLVESFTTERVGGVLRARTRVRFGEEAGEYLVHPALLDGCFQAIILMRPRIAGLLADDVYLPAGLRELRVVALPVAGESFVTEAVLRERDAAGEAMEFDLRLLTEDGRVLVEARGMTVKRVESHASERVAEDLHVVGWRPTRLPAAAAPGAAIGRHSLVFADGADWAVEANSGTASRAGKLARLLAGLGGRCTLVWRGEAFRALGDGERRLDLLGADEYELPLGDVAALDRLLGLVAAEAGRISDVLDLWAVEAGDGAGADLEAVMAAQDAGVKFVPTLVQAITRADWTQPPRLWLVTEGAQFVAEAPGPVRLAGATVWGMGAVLVREHPELRPCLVDLSAGDGRELDSLARLVLDEGRTVSEDRVALRGDLGFAERVLPCVLKDAPEGMRALAAGEAYRVEIERPGALEQLRLRAMESDDVSAGEPDSGEVAIEIVAAGLNFVDVTKALGLYPGLDPKLPLRLGGECSGRVVAVGAGVRDLRVGDAVVAITPAHTRVGMLASRAVVPAALAVRVPEGVALEDAGAQLLVYLTAHYGLNELARLRKGEWVLIHAGAGGVGLAAAKIAQALGARVIATASSAEKHVFLREWGVEYVLQSRTLEFADGVMAITGGRGVDVVLNSLSGEFIARSLEVLAPYGRFVELGKRDLYQDTRVGLKAFRRNGSYFVVDLPALVEEKREYGAELLRDVVEALGSGRWPVLPVEIFAASDAAEAFRKMAQGRHIGKLAIRFAGAPADLEVLPAKSGAAVVGQPRFHGDASYVITGGLGGVGLAVAEWMAENGAGQLVLVSRRAAGPEELAAMERMRAAGARVAHRRTDLLEREAVRGLMAEIGATMLPLRGILHAAAVIDDALVTDLRPERFDAVFGPKMRGVWHLHEAMLATELDFFVMFSSVASIFPQPGHGSYAAANAFLDSFAAYRRGMGLAASSINWTGWVGLGLARNMGTRGTIEASSADGLGSFDREEALWALGQAIWANPIQATAVRIEDEVIAGLETVSTLLREAVGGKDSSGTAAVSENAALVALMQAETQAERAALVEELLRTETGRVLKLAPERIGVNQPFGQLGIDSLMALELVRRINAALGLALPATAVFNYPTLTLLAGQIVARLGLDAAVPVAVVDSGARPAAEELSEEEALRALMEPGDASVGD